MRSNISIRAVGWHLVLALSLSCAPKKRILSDGDEVRISGVAKAAVLEAVDRQQLHYTTFSGRAKSNLTINKEQYDVTANVRIARNEAIWISVTALMGVEIARISITPDSIKIVNRLRSEYVEKPFAYLHNFTGNGLDFLSLQQLLQGELIGQATGNSTDVWQYARGYLLKKHMGGLDYAMQLDRQYRNSHTLVIDTTAQGQQLEAFYSNYQTIAGNTFPHQVDILIRAPGLTLRSEMRYSKVAYDEKIEMPFRIPPRYSEIQ